MNEASVLTPTVSLCLQPAVILLQYCVQHLRAGKHKAQHNNASQGYPVPHLTHSQQYRRLATQSSLMHLARDSLLTRLQTISKTKPLSEIGEAHSSKGNTEYGGKKEEFHPRRM